MFKKLKAMIMAVLMATIFPVLRIQGESPPANPPAGTPVPPKPVPLVSGKEDTELAGSKPAPTAEERVHELETEVSNKTSRITELESLAKENGDKVGTLDGSLKKAISSYKALITASNPDILPELISGETIEDLDSSLNKARELIGKVKTNLDQQAQKKRIPAGAPPRREADGSGLSAREKIQRGIGG